MKTSYKRLIITSLLCAGIVACSSDDDDSGSNDGSTTNGSTTGDADMSADLVNSSDAGSTSGPAPGVTPDAPEAVFDGTWVSNCAQVIELTGFSEFQRATLVVDGDTYVSTVGSFTDSDCSVPATPAEAVIDFSMQFPEGSVETPLGTAAFVDQEPESIIVDGIDATALQQLAGFGTQYSIFLVGTDGMLYFGAPADSADQRPTTLDTSVVFEMQ